MPDKLRRVAGPGRTDYLATTTLELHPRAVLRRHSHDEHQLVYAGTGVIAVNTDAGSWIAPADRAIWIPAGHPHQLLSYGNARMHGVGFALDVNPLATDGPAVVEVSPLLRELIIHCARPRSVVDGPERERAVQVLLDQLRPMPQRPVRLPLARDVRLVRACAAVEENLADALTLDRVAAMCDTSVRTLARLFQDELGMTYLQWRTQLRLHHALRLLAEGSSVENVAHRCGWASTSAFVDVFRRSFGHTPARYAARR
jgi:AraC-like DNA-binding protein/quercetin dioxygenase-like cupin family protein